MAKYSMHLRKKVVTEYMNNKVSVVALAKKYDVKSKSNISTRVKSYKKLVYEGIVRSQKKEKYTFDFELSVVELYLTTEVSYQELVLSVGINNPSIITR